MRDGLSREDKARLKVLERGNRELRQANEFLKKASAYFAQAELDRHSTDDHVYRRSPCGFWCRADLQCTADCTSNVLCAGSNNA